MTTRHPTRGGAALILSIILLAGLLLLGLPFLFSQSASLAGTRSLAHQQQATVGRDAAEQLGIGVAAYTVRERFLIDGNHAASTFLTTGPVSLEAISANSYGVTLDAAPLAYNGTPVNARLLGTTIADEQGKLDVNHLDVAAWHRLLGSVGIQDWDDNAVIDSEDLAVDDADEHDDDGLNALLNGDNDDADVFGQLAKALAELRFTLPGQRITSLDQLLRADTGHSADAAPAGDYTGNAAPTGSYGFRRPLTRSELDLLRPYLSLHVLAQGRLGLIDLGSTIAKHPDHDVSYFDSDISDVVRPGTVLAWENPGGTPAIRYGAYNAWANLAAASGLYLQDAVTSISTPGYVANRGFAIALPPAVNLHHAPTPVRSALGSVDGLPSPIERYGDLPSGSSTEPFQFLDPLFTGRELPPIDIASFGVIQIDSAAVANDPQSRAAAQRRRRIVAQAVPQEGPLERHWSTQGQLHALVVGRSGSLLDTWPRAVGRVRTLKPDETVQDPTQPAPAGAAPIGVRPRTMPTLASGWNRRREGAMAQRLPTHLPIDWKLAFGSDGLTNPGDVLRPMHINGSTGQPDELADTGAGFTPEDDLRPDGLHVAPGKRLAVVLRVEGGGNIPGPLRSVSAGTADLAGRHLSFWIKPDADLADETKVYPLLEARIPAGSAGQQMDGTAGFSELQNYLGLFYDRKQQLLVLVLAPPSIERTVDSAVRVPPDDVATTFDLDERCLGGVASWLPLAPRTPYPDAGGAQLAPWVETGAKFTTAATRLLKPNRVVHLYRVADTTSGGADRPFFRSERWCQIQVVLGGDRPGMAKLVVDGEVGRDVSRTPPTSVTAMAHGDHLALPALPLEVALPLVTPASQGGGAALGPIDIVVRPALGLSAADLFPARGMLRIDDEYITYESIQGNTFKGCVRGQRQNTQVDGAPANRWPNTQQHLVGALVTEGGYRLALAGGSLLRGGCVTAVGMGNGDPTPPATAPDMQWAIWCDAKVDGAPFQNVGGTTYRLPAAAVTLPVKPGSGVFAEFPSRGVIRFRGRIFAYTGKDDAGSVLTGLVSLDSWQSLPATTFEPRPDIDANASEVNPIELLSLEVAPGTSPFEASRYAATTAVTPLLLQLRHPATARVEWVSYDRFVRDAAGISYVFSGSGWNPSTRGRQRTDFRGRLNTRLTNPALVPVGTDIFPAGTRIVPVQQTLGLQAHWIATGDVVTLRRRPGTAMPSVQLLVRYAAMDGYDAAGGVNANDTRNEYFAFDDAIPDDIVNDPAAAGLPERIDPGNYELLCGNCWSGQDLTPMNPVNVPRGNLPRIDLLAGTLPASLVIGALDEESLEAELTAQTTATPPPPGAAMTAAQRDAYLAAREAELAATIDAVVAGPLRGIHDTANVDGIGIRRGLTSSGEFFTGIGAIGHILESTAPIFDQPMGLLAFDGEVIAYRRANENYATIIGTGLLDRSSGPGPAHALPDSPVVNGNVARPLLPALPLPIGPVTMVGDAVADHQWFRFVTETSVTLATSGVQLDAPAVLLCSPDGNPATCEMVGLSGPIGIQGRNGAFFTTAPWLRGQYNTPANTAGSVGHLAIGWWPRYASALPAAPTAEHFRSRAFSWASFPVALHGARFDAGMLTAIGVDSLARIVVQDTATDDLFTIQARASGASRSLGAELPAWAALTSASIANAPGLAEAGAAFAHDEFAGPVDGAELRVTWHYLPPPSALLGDIANAANRSPMLGAVRIRALAPAKVLAIEDAR